MPPIGLTGSGNGPGDSPAPLPLALRPTARIPELDGIRGLAILLVFLYHYFYVECLPRDGSVGDYLVKGLALTWSGVDLFFVLSGFLIASILLDNRNATNYYSVFYTRRAFRILPLYFLVLGLFFALRYLIPERNPGWAWLLNDPLPTWSYLTLLQNFTMAAADGFGPAFLVVTWSLAVEEQFYLLLPLLARKLDRRRLGLLALILIPTAPIVRTLLVWWSPERGTVDSYVLLFCRWDALFMGVLAAVALRSPKWSARLTAYDGRAVRYCLLGTGLAVVGLVILHEGWRSPAMRSLGHTVLAAFYTCLLLSAVLGHRAVGAFLRGRPLLFLGAISYGLYLLHHPVRGALFALTLGDEPHVNDLTTLALTLLSAALTVAVAWLSYRFFETPLLKLGHRWKYERDPRTFRPVRPLPFNPVLVR